VKRATIFFLLSLLAAALPVRGADPGGAKVLATTYAPDKVVYDVAVDTPERFNRLLDRVSYLGNLYADPFSASVVLVLHGPEVGFFASKESPKYKALMDRLQSLAATDIIQFRMCEVAAKARGLVAKDLPEFIHLVPMGDAEVVRLQRQGYAFMK
jgi:intracellular sulfur oxidation DsrE/DsrF family protein